jgi:hypothetical protein
MLDEIIRDVALKLGMLRYREYYQIDTVFCHEIDAVHFKNPAYRYVKYISVAIEHENDCSTAAVEMNRLQLYNVPLAVLITYPSSRAKAAPTLKKYATIIRQADVFENASKERRQLAIFGYRGNGRVDWDAFVYQEGSFVRLKLGASRARPRNA